MPILIETDISPPPPYENGVNYLHGDYVKVE